MLQVRQLCKEYRTGDLVQKALDHVDLNLRDNEFVAILGPSGSGKTTLLNIIGFPQKNIRTETGIPIGIIPLVLCFKVII